jgi:predicted Zn-dependent peptidase
VQDAHQFFDRYYSPANALLSVCGDVDPDDAIRLAERHFAEIPYRPAPPRPDFGEPMPTAERRIVQYDRHAPVPAVAAAWRVPDPVRDWDNYLPYTVLAQVASDGPASRLHRRLVRTDAIATAPRCYVGFLSDPLDVGDPTALVVTARQAPTATADTVLDAIDDEFTRLATDGPDRHELARTITRMRTELLHDTESMLGRIQALATLELRHGRAELLAELPDLLAAVGADAVGAAAGSLTADRRAVVELLPGTEPARKDAAA